MMIAPRGDCAYGTEGYVEERIMRMTALLLIGAALTAPACGSNNGALSDNDRNAIRAASQKYVEADDKRDADAMLLAIGEGAYYMPSNGAPISGREAIRSFLKPHPWDKITQTPAEIEGRDGLAFVRGSYTVLYQGQNLTGYYIEIWQKQPDGAWKITRKLWNSDKAPQ
jgi:ketosteroid isomerase-like protein